MDRRMDGTDHNIPDLKKETLAYFSKISQNDSHKIHFLKRSIICVIQYTSASSNHMHIVSNASTVEKCNTGMFLQ